jgi:hypothetical protein
MYIFAFLVALRLYKDAQLLPLLYLNIILTYDRWTLAEGMPVIGKMHRIIHLSPTFLHGAGRLKELASKLSAVLSSYCMIPAIQADVAGHSLAWSVDLKTGASMCEGRRARVVEFVASQRIIHARIIGMSEEPIGPVGPLGPHRRSRCFMRWCTTTTKVANARQVMRRVGTAILVPLSGRRCGDCHCRWHCRKSCTIQRWHCTERPSPPRGNAERPSPRGILRCLGWLREELAPSRYVG